ncbi:hypothetical protein V2H45_10225 [Tumidithrix elongata RA019]|uniref:Uncharacterized protein n=1 Tax=Tumidithrix elongata BACA0141 TaxID=2716417 RepID=A0AAW9Q2J7_9CYAN|nr:hypothetical protein [Tumidithrix elongata RA019]
MQVTVEIPDEIMLQLNQTGLSVQDLIMQAIQRHIYKEVPLVQTQTWQLCGGLQVEKELNVHNYLDAVTNYAENIDDVF